MVEAAEKTIVPTRVHIRVMTGTKTSVINITDLDGCSKAKGLNGRDALLLQDLSEFLADVHEDSADAGLVELTPDNVGLVELTPDNVAKVLQPVESQKQSATT